MGGPLDADAPHLHGLVSPPVHGDGRSEAPVTVARRRRSLCDRHAALDGVAEASTLALEHPREAPPPDAEGVPVFFDRCEPCVDDTLQRRATAYRLRRGWMERPMTPAVVAHSGAPTPSPRATEALSTLAARVSPPLTWPNGSRVVTSGSRHRAGAVHQVKRARGRVERLPAAQHLVTASTRPVEGWTKRFFEVLLVTRWEDEVQSGSPARSAGQPRSRYTFWNTLARRRGNASLRPGWGSRAC